MSGQSTYQFDEDAAGAVCASIGRCCACYNLRRASRAVSRFYDACLAPVGLRATQFSMLLACRNRGPLPLTRLAELLVAERTTLTRNLGVLEGRGLVRVESGKDRRERVISITEAGLAVLEEALPLWSKAQGQLEERLGRERLGRLLDDLRELTQAALL